MPTVLVERLHRGSRELTFGGIPYRPDRAGLHDTADIAELAITLGMTDPDRWSAESVCNVSPDERADELAFARQCFADLRAMIETARANSRIIVCEEI